MTNPRPAAPTNVAVLIGGPCAGQTITRKPGKGWPRFLDGGTAQPIHGDQGEKLLRTPHRDAHNDRGVYVQQQLPRTGAPDSTTYLHSSAHTDPQNAWHLAAVALAGSHAGRCLAHGSDDPHAVLDALLDHCDDLIRLRLDRDRRRHEPSRLPIPPRQTWTDPAPAERR